MENTLKLLFKGTLNFVDERSYQMAYEDYTARIAAGFSNDILFAAEESFFPEERIFRVPKLTSYAGERTARRTKEALAKLATFAGAGLIRSWVLENGNVIEHNIYEPRTEKTIVQSYLRGRDLVYMEGKEAEAEAALTMAIERFERHAMAYAWRGYVKLRLRDAKSAAEDFSRSIQINDEIPDPYYGRAKVAMLHNQWEKAISDLDMTIKHSIPLMTIFWRAKLKRGICLFHLKRYEEAVVDLKQYVNRAFNEQDPNFQKRRKAFKFLGKSYLELGHYDLAIEAFDKAEAIVEGSDRVLQRDLLYLLGLAKQRAGKKGFLNHIKEAAAQGSEAAAALLADLG